MKKLPVKIVIGIAVLTIMLGIVLRVRQDESICLTGAFISDKPLTKDILKFKRNYGKKPFIIIVFVDWESFVDSETIKDVYAENCRLMVTWEPWKAVEKSAVDYEKLLEGEFDFYIKEFAEKLRNINKPVFLRFAHEMNGNWYPWSGTKIGKDLYIRLYRYIYTLFEEIGVDNVRWVFSINAEDVPQEKNNYFLNYYPGDKYVDYIGIDGYNWAGTRSFSKWMTFNEIFEKPYTEINKKIHKPIIITEFGCAGGSGKTRWIKEAMTSIRKRRNVKAFILFNVDKEAEWSFPAGSEEAEELKRQLADPYFQDKN